ncbi:ATPase component of general energizing module of ECF transporters [Liquorilactobacillus sucicola DSM 21376 = JCM 15457]|uniref:Energy-coupling factor transporter ATP-binding protein EcfA2 n=1 Tax=Liquorilactobacillus sucicola DSM 21376 = JCM 15457 TaxID=1423806 RepID=A0A023CWF7_9LACO|nr:energy-coupling factor transporter ATPase [Liquorilactobacillus sucicola]KRN06248.1 abc transporter atpase component [Liquorilactobacillus sucicola DSM 21376 = JCM 15457]GAJ26182.1 ATPase component of general energizing module of ECF transporters [Liquorilactobacillus sucicola DSM 21376 = JCM 15457]
MNLLKIENIQYSYGKNTPFEKEVLKNISLEVNANDFIGVIGHTGSGKSTLIKICNGLLKPDKGQIFYKGENIWKKGFDLKHLRFKVGVSFQYPEHQLFCETVKKDIAYGLVNKGVPEEEQESKIRQVLKIVGLQESYLEKSPFKLSGGEMRKVALAGTMVLEPEVLILDEPTAGLDPKTTKQVYESLKEYQAKTSSSIIVVSHSMEDISEYATRLIALDDGNILLRGTPAQVFSNTERLNDMSLDVPITTSILSMLAQKNPSVNTNIYRYNDTKAEIIRLLKDVKSIE